MSEMKRSRPIRIPFFVDESEREIIDKKAALAKLDRSKYIRKMALDGYIIKQDLETIRELTQEIHKIGVNINQIAKHSNEVGAVTNKEIDEIKRMMAEIWQLLRSELSKKSSPKHSIT